MVMKRKNEDEEELDMSKAAKLDPPPEEVKNSSPILEPWDLLYIFS